MVHCVHLDDDCLLQLAKRLSEELLVCVIEFYPHVADVSLTDEQELRWPCILTSDRETAPQASLFPIFQVIEVGQASMRLVVRVIVLDF